MEIILRQLRSNDEIAFYKALDQWDSSPGFLFSQGYLSSMSFNEYLKLLADNEKGLRLPNGYVPATILCGFVGSEIIGRVSIRHELNNFLFNVGGNIGYGVLPPWRGNGYAKAMLMQSLGISKNMGLSKVLLTCDDDNIASIKTIESC